MIFDTHAHYDADGFDIDRESILEELPAQGVGRVVNIGAGMEGCRMTLDFMDRYSYFYGALGIHPGEAAELTESDIQWLKEKCAHPKCVAVGEIGLDYYWPEPDHEIQKKWFRRQLDLAREVRLPVVIHSRDALQDTLEIMKEEKAEDLGGVIHCFSYTKESARIFLDMGFYLGVGGVVTFKNSRKLKEAVEYAPMDRIVLETDCPYLAPEPNRGKRNISTNLTYVAETVGQLKGLTASEVERITWENACRMYRMED